MCPNTTALLASQYHVSWLSPDHTYHHASEFRVYTGGVRIAWRASMNEGAPIPHDLPSLAKFDGSDTLLAASLSPS